ncbi:GGDEF domain-containing protein [Fulvimarina sp. MAC8]|uniref:GGDEF domain-containing protein n=1 Tax=Fulvimarina sp. MAC8 TaxID=3162874 RepID=UPI0032EC68C0
MLSGFCAWWQSKGFLDFFRRIVTKAPIPAEFNAFVAEYRQNKTMFGTLQLFSNLRVLLSFTFLVMIGAIGSSILLTGHMNVAMPEPWSQQSFVTSWVVPCVIGLPIWIIMATILIRNDRLLRKVENLSRYDALTGLLNRRAFFEIGCQELKFARNRGNPLIVVAMLDLDCFKVINDTHGHPTGDAALVAMARLFGHCDLPQTVNARLGGDEFVVLFAGASARAAEAHMERYRELVSSLSIDSPSGACVKVSTSIGLSSVLLDEGSDPRTELEKLLADADGALYEAKVGGRNRVATAA